MQEPCGEEGFPTRLETPPNGNRRAVSKISGEKSLQDNASALAAALPKWENIDIVVSRPRGGLVIC